MLKRPRSLLFPTNRRPICDDETPLAALYERTIHSEFTLESFRRAQDRPAFKALKDFMSEVIPPEMKSTKNFAAEGKLSVNEGDVIVILSGKAEHHWWKGQNKRTCQVGEFPRNIVCSSRPICGDDIRYLFTDRETRDRPCGKEPYPTDGFVRHSFRNCAANR